LVGVQRSGARRRVAIAIGFPYAIRDRSGAALAFVRRRLLDFVESGNRLLFADGKEELPIEAYFPRYEREPNSGASPVRVCRATRGKFASAHRGRVKEAA